MTSIAVPRTEGVRPLDSGDTAADARIELAVRLAAFFATAAFAAGHWAGLFLPAPTSRLLLAAVVATAVGALLSLSAVLPRGVRAATGALTLVLGIAVGFMAIGIRARLLWPTHWDTLSDRVTGGVSVIGSVSQWPYEGPNVWLRLTALMAAPLVLTLAAAMAFWPVRKPRLATSLRFGSLALLILLYGVAAAARPFGAQGLRGLALLAIIAAWLWLPRLRGRDALVAAAVIAAAGLIGLGLTAKVASTEPWVDYRQWSWTLHKEKTVGFDWRHSYGPIHWPRKGTTVLLIKAKRPHYWRAEALDRFDGFRWTVEDGSRAPLGPNDMPKPERADWQETSRVTFRALRSQLAIAPGRAREFEGPARTILLSSGAYVLEGQLTSGDTYTVKSYTPDPKPAEMRKAPPPDASLAPFTRINLPDDIGSTSTAIDVPLRGTESAGSIADAGRIMNRSRYGRIYRLARRITAGAPTTYQMVLDVGNYLQRTYQYSERPPKREFPLDAFLFRDKIGYCQQFSGAEALMLRMLGIPARVVAGFAPGTRDAQTHEFVVRDLDAHSWIEVWFEDIGWVTFDPTPAVAPAASQSIALAPKAGDRKPKGEARSHPDPLNVSGAGSAGGSGGGADDGARWGLIALVGGALLILASALVAFIRGRRVRRRPRPAPCGDAEVDRLLTLLARLGLEVGPEATLLTLEERLRRLAGADAGDYARRLRERRFAANGPEPPAKAERRELRQALADAVGAGRLTRLHMALPEHPPSIGRGLKLVR